jgi:hypothetical protein
MAALVAVMVAAGCGGDAAAQDLRQRIEGAADGTVRLGYAPRPGVCGNGRNISHRRSGGGEWERDCEPGPVRAAVDVRSGTVTAVRVYVGGRWRAAEGPVTDLGTVSAPRAAEYFLSLAERNGSLKDDVIMGAVLADSATVWSSLLRIARNQDLPRRTRKSAVFWVSVEAGDAATRGLAELAEDERQDSDVREQAVFALSQLPDDSGVPTLIRVAKTSPDPKVRKKAIFWLGQSEDPRALALFEELLASRP